MKPGICKATVVAVVTFTMITALAAFITGEPNPVAWDLGTRFLVVSVWVIFMVPTIATMDVLR